MKRPFSSLASTSGVFTASYSRLKMTDFTQCQNTIPQSTIRLSNRISKFEINRTNEALPAEESKDNGELLNDECFCQGELCNKQRVATYPCFWLVLLLVCLIPFLCIWYHFYAFPLTPTVFRLLFSLDPMAVLCKYSRYMHWFWWLSFLYIAVTQLSWTHAQLVPCAWIFTDGWQLFSFLLQANPMYVASQKGYCYFV